MVALIVLLCPAVLAVWCYEALTKTELTRKKWFYRYTLNLVGINLICFIMKRFVLNSASAVFYTLSEGMLPSVALNYLIMAIPAAVIFALLQVFCKKNIEVSVEDKSNAK